MMKKLYLLLFAIFSIYSTQAQNLYPDENEKGKFGYKNDNGEIVIQHIYTEAYPFTDGVAKVKKGKKYGFINSAGEEVLTPAYDEIGTFEGGFTHIKKGKKYGIINDNFETILEPKYVAVGTFDRYGFCWVAAGGKIDNSGKLTCNKYGIINTNGEFVIPAKYPFVGYFYEVEGSEPSFTAYGATSFNKYSLQKPFSQLYNEKNYLSVMLEDSDTREKTDSLTRIFNQVKIYTNPKYLYFGNASRNFALVDSAGNIVIAPKIAHKIVIPCDDVAWVEIKIKKNKYPGYYNLTNQNLKTFNADDQLSSFNENLGKVTQKDGSSYFVDKDGNKVSPTYRKSWDFNDGICVVQDDVSGKFGAINRKAQTVIAFIYNDIWTKCQEGLLGVSQYGKWGFVNTSGENVIPMEYLSVSAFTNGKAAAKTANGWGMIDSLNNTIIPFEWEDLLLPTEEKQNLFWCKDRDSLWYCYDIETDTLAFERGYSGAGNFVEGVASILHQGKYGAIDTTGNIVIPCQFDALDLLTEAFEYMRKNNKTSLSDVDGFRLNLYQDASVNSYKVTDVIPEEKWDY